MRYISPGPLSLSCRFLKRYVVRIAIHVLLNHQYGEDIFLPNVGEVIIVRLSQDLRGPGSELELVQLLLLEAMISLLSSWELLIILPMWFSMSSHTILLFHRPRHPSTLPAG